MKYLPIFLLLSIFTTGIYGQQIIAGPMLGYVTMTEAAVWVQMDRPCDLALEYWPINDPDKIKTTEMVIAEKPRAVAAKLILERLEPATTYAYRLIINREKMVEVNNLTTQKLWQWREPSPDFSFLAGSCVYINETAYDRPGEPYGGQYEIFNTMSKESADFMVWLGDNTYLREVDWDSRSGIYHRFSHSRQIPELQPLLKNMHHYAIWDDHDYGSNDSDRSYAYKNITRQAFIDFWANPNFGAGGMEGITGTFNWNDCQFFLLDNRWYRTPKDKKGQILGDKQIEWLIESLRGSNASFKFICVGGQFLSDVQLFENHANYVKERKKLIKLLDQHKIQGVVFLTGDRHHSEISKYSSKNGQVYYDVTSSPITSGSYDHSSEKNSYRLPGTIIDIKSYAQINVRGDKANRKCTVYFKDKDGKIVVEQELVFPKTKKGSNK